MKQKFFGVLSALTILFSILFPVTVAAAPSNVYEQDKVLLNYDYYQDPTAPMSVTSKDVFAPAATDYPYVGYVRINVKKTGGQAVYWALKDEAGNTWGEGYLQHTGDLVRFTFNVPPNQKYKLTVGCHTGPSCSAKGQISTLTHVIE